MPFSFDFDCPEEVAAERQGHTLDADPFRFVRDRGRKRGTIKPGNGSTFRLGLAASLQQLSLFLFALRATTKS